MLKSSYIFNTHIDQSIIDEYFMAKSRQPGSTKNCLQVGYCLQPSPQLFESALHLPWQKGYSRFPHSLPVTRQMLLHPFPPRTNNRAQWWLLLMHRASLIQNHFCCSVRFVVLAQTFVWRTLSMLSAIMVKQT